MKAKKGYKKLKHKYSTGKWLKRYFQKRTTRKFIKNRRNQNEEEMV